MNQARLVGVGVFVLGGLLLFAIGLFLIGNRRNLFVDRFEVQAEFAKVTGLQRGAIVRVAGMDAGEVEQIRIPPGPASRFRVQMRVREDLHQLVRADSVASIQTDGLVGNKFVQIDIGTDQAPRAPEGSTIRSREPFDLADLMIQVSETVKTLDATLVQLRGNIEETLGAVTKTAKQATGLVEDVGADIRVITRSGQQVVKDIREVTNGIAAGRGTFGRLVKDDELYARATAIAKETEQTVAQMRQAVDEARQTVGRLNESVSARSGPVQGMASDLRQSMAFAREAMADLAENTESLKRSFLFRGYFRGRGYYDLDSITHADYLAGDFAGKDRAPLRIMLDAAVLFTTDAEGTDALTPDGRQRLDSAMATFLRYPKQMPAVRRGLRGRADRGCGAPAVAEPRGAGARIPHPALRAEPEHDRPDADGQARGRQPARRRHVGRRRPRALDAAGSVRETGGLAGLRARQTLRSRHADDSRTVLERYS